MNLPIVLLLLFQACRIQAYAAFAHFMVTNTAKWTQDTWAAEIKLAQEAHIDAFALNMAYDEATNSNGLKYSFAAAEAAGFQLFISFDYAGNGAWPKDTVISFIKQYSSSSAYYHYNGKPFVSTFEGPGSASDWEDIKSSTNCFFIPDWSSLGAKAALALNQADGLFSWAAWPWGSRESDTYTDASYIQFLSGLPYMMPVSPWFYTNLPGYDKNWLWRGDHLWFDRWQEVMYLRPEFVEIISWNDYGESHYIGPLHDDGMDAFDIGEANYNYVTDMPHDGWRLFLPFVIDTYKSGIASVTQEGLVTWYRLHPVAACSSGGTTANTASQLELEFEPADVLEDEIFFSALLGSSADITVTIGGSSQKGSWKHTPEGGVGIYHGSVSFSGKAGDVVVTLSRSGTTIAEISGEAITSSCTNGIQNYNAWVGSDVGSSVSATPSLNLADRVCINGTGVYNFAGLCEYSCELGYCPIGACVCTDMGAQKDLPESQNIEGYPLEGESPSYLGLCSFDCNYGYCPDTACGTVSAPLTTPTVSEFSPPACVAGEGEGNLAGLCSFSCNYGFCPIAYCKCTGEGALADAPEKTTTVTGYPIGTDTASNGGDLCNFACQHGYCPDGACTSSVSSPTTSDVATTVTNSPHVFITTGASCSDLEDEVLNSDLWDDTDTTSELKEWLDDNDTSNFCADIALDVGDGQGLTCKIGDTCARPSCADLDDPDAANSGWKYEVMVACANLNHYLDDLYEGLGAGLTQFASLQIDIQQTFWPTASDAGEQLLIKEFLNGLATAATIAATIVGGAAAGVAAAALGGGLTLYMATLSTSDKTLKDIAAMEKTANTLVVEMQKAIDAANTGFLSDAKFESTSIVDVFDDGAWLDYREIPVLNTDTDNPIVTATDLASYFTALVYGVIINKAWTKQNVFIMCFPMTKDEFDSLDVKAGSNDSRLKYYHPGYGKGCYFQSAMVYKSAGVKYPIARNPPGWGSLGNSPYVFTNHDVLLGSIESFYNDNGGFDYNGTYKEIKSLIYAGDETYSVDDYSWPGVFNIPICELSADDVKDYTAKGLVKLLNEPNNVNQFPSYCYCWKTKDRFGRTLYDTIDLKQFDKDNCGSSDDTGVDPGV